MGFPVGGRVPGRRRMPASVGLTAAPPQEHHGAEQDRQNSADQAQSGRIHKKLSFPFLIGQLHVFNQRQ
jgi:hypothetical protein